MIIGITDGNKNDLTNLAKMTKKAVMILYYIICRLEFISFFFITCKNYYFYCYKSTCFKWILHFQSNLTIIEMKLFQS